MISERVAGVADEKKQWRFRYVWRRPEGYPFSEDEIDEHYEGSDDHQCNTSDWDSFVLMPAFEHIGFKYENWPEALAQLLDWLLDEMRDRQAIMAVFDTPTIARKLKMPIPDLLAARDALIRLHVVWFNPDGYYIPYGEDENEDAWTQRAEIGVNYRFQKWENDPAIRQQVWDEEQSKYRAVRTRPQEAHKHLQRNTIPNDLRWQIYARDKFTCRYCGASGVPLALDHLIPVLRGGTNEPGNLVTSCQSCNSRKGAQWPEER